jgi:hypothetical protein
MIRRRLREVSTRYVEAEWHSEFEPVVDWKGLWLLVGERRV